MSESETASWLIWFTTTYKPVIDFFSAFLAPVVAITVAYIVYQHWRTNQRALRFQQYERRLKVYNGVQEFLRKVIQTGVAEPHMNRLLDALDESHYLFGYEIPEYIEQLWEKACALATNISMLKDRNLKNEEHKQHSKSSSELLGYFGDQVEVSRNNLRKYLQQD